MNMIKTINCDENYEYMESEQMQDTIFWDQVLVWFASMYASEEG